MIKVLLQILLATVAATAVPFQSVSRMDDGSYQFFYETGEDAGNQMRSESRGSDGIVVGKYGYLDPTGEHRLVSYRAGDFGYVAKGDISVPGAPQGQLPPEPEHEQATSPEHDEKSDKNEEKAEENHEDKKQEPSHDEAKQPEDEEEEEDDVKPMKLQETSGEAPPDGFPVGFFTHQFHNLRRLPEPEMKEEEQDKKVKKEGSEEEPHKEDAAIKAGAHHHDPHLASFTHPSWAAGPLSYVPGAHQPVYVYSYQHPQAHGYYYIY